jgi:hypothetical protein
MIIENENQGQLIKQETIKNVNQEEFIKNNCNIDTNTIQLIDRVYKYNRVNINISKDHLNMQNSLSKKISSNVYLFSYYEDKLGHIDYFSPSINERKKLEITRKFLKNENQNKECFNFENEITHARQSKENLNFKENISEYFTILYLLKCIQFNHEQLDEFEMINLEKRDISKEFLLKYLTSEYVTNLMKNKSDCLQIIEKLKKIRENEFTNLMKDNTNFKYEVEEYEIIDSDMLDDDEDDEELMADLLVEGDDDDMEEEFESDD